MITIESLFRDIMFKMAFDSPSCYPKSPTNMSNEGNLKLSDHIKALFKEFRDMQPGKFKKEYIKISN
jgi:hypothetical protein